MTKSVIKDNNNNNNDNKSNLWCESMCVYLKLISNRQLNLNSRYSYMNM